MKNKKILFLVLVAITLTSCVVTSSGDIEFIPFSVPYNELDEYLKEIGKDVNYFSNYSDFYGEYESREFGLFGGEVEISLKYYDDATSTYDITYSYAYIPNYIADDGGDLKLFKYNNNYYTLEWGTEDALWPLFDLFEDIVNNYPDEKTVLIRTGATKYDWETDGSYMNYTNLEKKYQIKESDVKIMKFLLAL